MRLEGELCSYKGGGGRCVTHMMPRPAGRARGRGRVHAIRAAGGSTLATHARV